MIISIKKKGKLHFHEKKKKRETPPSSPTIEIKTKNELTGNENIKLNQT